MATTAASNHVLYPLQNPYSLNDLQQQPKTSIDNMMQESRNSHVVQLPPTPTDQEESSINNIVHLPPTPTASDNEEEEAEEEEEEEKALQQHKLLREKTIKMQRRGTVSLRELIPVASAALRAKHRAAMAAQSSIQDSPLARALTKVKIGVQTSRLKEKYLLNEWIRLALAAPVDESTINTASRAFQRNRTMEIVKWFELKFSRISLSLDELEQRVDSLRRQKLLVQQQKSMTNSKSTSSLPSPPPATYI
ncbi:hypothetical protein [Parasitella parasitica]|uniref:Uncharacterized protein n=1 Tax=Parasitella parasitica TaxID=35722 RepID=A0A0B7NJ27_9FUNG|nr:hypothetical protein [Parasitella parasitica]